MKSLQDIINDFLKNMDLIEEEQLEAIAHLIEIELMERDIAKNPQRWGEEQ